MNSCLHRPAPEGNRGIDAIKNRGEGISSRILIYFACSRVIILLIEYYRFIKHFLIIDLYVFGFQKVHEMFFSIQSIGHGCGHKIQNKPFDSLPGCESILSELS
jgi:hypothetical protein